MTTGKDGASGRHLRMAFDLGAARDLGDGRLLERFAAGRGEAAELAFAVLVERHGPMVLRVARGILDDPHDAQDAFQATFLVLIARARGLWVRDSLGPWLHQTAHRTASRLRANRARRRRLDLRVAVPDEARPPDPADDSARVLHEEIDRLPERYRAPVVLCDLEGRTHEQAARSLGWPIGTVKSRQARARDRLRDRLARRGIAPGLLLPAFRPELLPTLSTALVGSTTAAAVRFLASRAIAPGPAAALAREVIRTMTFLRWAKLAPALLGLGVASGAGLLAQDRGAQPADPPAPAVKDPARPARDPSFATVVPQKLESAVLERGAVEASGVRDIICEVMGNAAILSIKPEGTRVRKGEVVAVLDPSAFGGMPEAKKIAIREAEMALHRARLTREVAEIAVKEYVEGVAPRDAEDLQAKVAIAEAGVEKGRARLERTKLARKRLDEANARRVGPETAADVAADLAIADRLDEAEHGLRALELELDAAKGRRATVARFAVDKTTRLLQADVEEARRDELLKQTAWERAKSEAERLERQIEGYKLVAPGDGLLVYVGDKARAELGQPIEAGAIVRDRETLLSVVDLSEPMRVNAKVSEALVDQIRLGQAVNVKVDAVPDQEMTGVVRSVAPMADPKSVASGRKVYTILIQIDKAAPNLRPGMAASVHIPLFELDGVLVVLLDSVIRIDNKDWLAVQGPGGAIEMRQVTLGRVSNRAVEVKQGLRPGDRVLIDPGHHSPRRQPPAPK